MPARKQGIVTLALMVPALGLFAPALAQQFDVTGARSAIIAETNAYRAERGLPALRENAGANRLAQAYATYLARTDKTGHGADGRSPSQRLRAGGVTYCKFRGENWHRSWTRPKRASVGTAVGKAMAFWKRSPGHERALRSASTDIGVGAVGWKHGGRWIYTEVQLFIDTTCRGAQVMRATTSAEQVPSLPDRNPQRLP
ncbi:MAG TPA: CAP domain-containing protein [Methyloceanibacter sp.]|nr:CAP domain-containing protein [Methyloceanibacter sp.]